jgi:hypothetical protein
MMENTEQDQNGAEIIPYEQICPRHGARVRQSHGCPKCVMEEVRRHERRIHLPIMGNQPVSAPSNDSVDPLAAELL